MLLECLLLFPLSHWINSPFPIHYPPQQKVLCWPSQSAAKADDTNLSAASTFSKSKSNFAKKEVEFLLNIFHPPPPPPFFPSFRPIPHLPPLVIYSLAPFGYLKEYGGQLSPSKPTFPSNHPFHAFLDLSRPRGFGGYKKARRKAIHHPLAPNQSTKTKNFPLAFPSSISKKRMSIEVTHEWTGQQWDWPLQQNDGIVKVHDLPDKWEVGIDVAFFTPKEIEVKVVGDHLNIHCKHESRNDEHGSVSREINRSYRLPDTVNTGTIRSHLTQNGVLRVSAQKK